MALEQDFVDAIYDRCAKRDILVMTDEVQTGMGRTGTLLAGEQFGHHADVVTLAKGIACGLPMGAFWQMKSVLVFWESPLMVLHLAEIRFAVQVDWLFCRH